MTRKPSMFFAEKRVLTVFPYWIVVAALIIIALMSCLPSQVSRILLHSSVSKLAIKRLMSVRGLVSVSSGPSIRAGSPPHDSSF